MVSRKLVWWNPLTWFVKKPMVVTPPMLGSFWSEMGGYYVGVMRMEESAHEYYHLVLEPKWRHREEIPFGLYSHTYQGNTSLRHCLSYANSTSFSDGILNLSLSSGHNLNDDAVWYIPSIQELSLAVSSCREHLYNSEYWSSTYTKCGRGYSINLREEGVTTWLEKTITDMKYIALMRRIPVRS